MLVLLFLLLFAITHTSTRNYWFSVNPDRASSLLVPWFEAQLPWSSQWILPGYPVSGSAGELAVLYRHWLAKWEWYQLWLATTMQALRGHQCGVSETATQMVSWKSKESVADMLCILMGCRKKGDSWSHAPHFILLNSCTQTSWRCSNTWFSQSKEILVKQGHVAVLQIINNTDY